jgi:WD40 repeat protein
MKARIQISVVLTSLCSALMLISTLGHADPVGLRPLYVADLFESKAKKTKNVARLVAELRENGDIRGLDFSPDGKSLAAIPYMGPINVWDWQSGRVMHALERPYAANIGQTTEPIRYSPDGRLLAICHSLARDTVVARIWNTSTWEIVRDITDAVGGGSCTAIGFTPDGKSLIRVLERTFTKPGDNLVIYNTDTWEPTWGLRTIPFEPTALTISPDGKFIAVGGNLFDFSPAASTVEAFKRKEQPQIALVDMAQRAIVRTIQSPFIKQLAWSPDGIHIAAAGIEAIHGATGVQIFDWQSGKLTIDESFKIGHMFLRYTPDGRYLIESGESGLRVWDGQHRELLQEIRHSGSSRNPAMSLAVSPDGHYFAAGIYTKIFVWQLN